MSLVLLIAVAVAGAAGAVSRWGVDALVTRSLRSINGTLGTLTVNITGSFALGALLGLALTHDLPPLLVTAIGAGFLGAYTTFSTWMFQAATLWEKRAWRALALNVLLPLATGPAAAALGLWIF